MLIDKKIFFSLFFYKFFISLYFSYSLMFYYKVNGNVNYFVRGVVVVFNNVIVVESFL